MNPSLEFRKSSYSNRSQDCVEVAALSERARAIRDTKHRERGALVFPAAEWRAFLNEVKTDRI
ncbi:hypothetical protein HNR23_001728 [Nocardiopsis mwathae]|uniref:DUF397 domain-containing protein n=1 Tax=Nocardiopsis mwathae TaxID=1472723 RepID=A0A7W9YGD7_9ACTN|nr:DUF397 domain-containing protein [Nocardiopsis mwathae]MBB6171668.1 hypothetical protein [Nocardiopsis mwathae]